MREMNDGSGEFVAKLDGNTSVEHPITEAVQVKEGGQCAIYCGEYCKRKQVSMVVRFEKLHKALHAFVSLASHIPYRVAVW